MFVLCDSMKWNHLPVAGGLYDQDPDLLEGFMYIFRARSEHQEEEERKREGKAKATNKPSAAGGMRA